MITTGRQYFSAFISRYLHGHIFCIYPLEKKGKPGLDSNYDSSIGKSNTAPMISCTSHPNANSSVVPTLILDLVMTLCNKPNFFTDHRLS